MTKPEDAQAEMYRARARAYHDLVSAEDCDHQLEPMLSSRLSACERVLEVGAGTGRLTAVLPHTAAIIATEREEKMLALAREHLAGRSNLTFLRADARALPVADESVDAVLAGWVFGHLRLWMPEDWREQVSRALGEARRVLRGRGTIVIIETLGTGTSEASPPSEALGEYYRFLEADHGFLRDVIATDYAFEDPEHAARILGPFFGESMVARIRENSWSRVPERTGVWTLRLD